MTYNVFSGTLNLTQLLAATDSLLSTFPLSLCPVCIYDSSKPCVVTVRGSVDQCKLSLVLLLSS